MTEPPDHGPTDQRETSRLPVGDVHEQEIDLEDLLQRRAPRRRRVLQGLGLAVVLVVVASIIGRSLSGGTSRPREVVPSPTPVPLGPVLVLSDVSFGVLTLNGRQLAASPPVVTAFRRGMNTFVLTAPPFLPRTCQVSWPAVQIKGLCVVLSDQSYVAVVDFGLSGEDLPPDVRTRTLDSINTALRALPLGATVPAGEYVATGLDAHGRIVSERVAGGWHADLVPTATMLNFSGDLFCTGPACVPLTASAAEWVVSAGASVQWQYTTLTAGGASRSSPSFGAWSLRLILTTDAQGGWEIDQQRSEQLNGFSLVLATQALVCRAGSNYLDAHRPSDQLNSSVVVDHGLEGCELQLTTRAGASVGTFIWRFGVLLAADAQAQALLPDLPKAPASAFTALGEPVPAGL